MELSLSSSSAPDTLCQTPSKIPGLLQNSLRTAFLLTLTGCTYVIPLSNEQLEAVYDTRLGHVPILEEQQFQRVYDILKKDWGLAAAPVLSQTWKTENEKSRAIKQMFEELNRANEAFLYAYVREAGMPDALDNILVNMTEDYKNTFLLEQLKNLLARHNLLLQLVPYENAGKRVFLPQVMATLERRIVDISKGIDESRRFLKSDANVVCKTYLDQINIDSAQEIMGSFLQHSGINFQNTSWRVQLSFGTHDPLCGGISPFNKLASVGGTASYFHDLEVVIPHEDTGVRNNTVNTTAHEMFHNVLHIYSRENNLPYSTVIPLQEDGYPPSLTFGQINETCANLLSTYMAVLDLDLKSALQMMTHFSSEEIPHHNYLAVPFSHTRVLKHYQSKLAGLSGLKLDEVSARVQSKQLLLESILEESHLLLKKGFSQPGAVMASGVLFFDPVAERRKEISALDAISSQINIKQGT